MADTVYASFDDPALAEKAAGALLDYGVHKEDLSLVHSEAYAQNLNSQGALRRSDLDPMIDDDESKDLERSAKAGLSTTTAGDAEAGALKGAEVGLGLGVIAGLASLFIPGVGLVTGGGALAAATGAAAGTAVAGAVAGGAVGYLKDQGVPDEAASRYQGDLEKGGAMVAVRVPSGKVDETAARQVLLKYSANNVAIY